MLSRSLRNTTPRWITGLLLLTLACKGTAPTAPAAQDLNGTWTGAVTFESQCASEKVTVPVSQWGTYVSVPVTTKCYGLLGFQGRVSGNNLNGTLDHTCVHGNEYVRSSGVRAPTEGTSDGHHLRLEATATSNSGCALPQITIDLSR